MKIIKNFISVIAVACVLASVSLTAFANHTRVVDLTDEEVFNQTWENVVDNDFDMNNIRNAVANGDKYATLPISIYYSAYKSFMSDYNARSYDSKYDDDITDVRDEYIDYFEKKFDVNSQMELENGIMVQTSADTKMYWIYDDAKDSFICKNSKMELVKTIDNYPIESNTSTSQQSSNPNEQGTSNSTNSSAISGGDTSAVTRATEGNTEVVTAANQSASTESNNVSAIQILLVIVGILIIIGIIVIIVMLKRRNNEEK